MKVSELFLNEPASWGLRGDPYLWREMGDASKSLDLPNTEAELQKFLEQLFYTITGHSIHSEEPFLIERFARGGMSSGMVSPRFWCREALPMLLQRYRNIPSAS